VVSATHRDLDGVFEGDGFRADLFFRLAAVRLRLPPLRERGEDVVLLARHFLARAAAACEAGPPGLDPALAAHLRRYPWPGNVRELAHACAYAVRVAGARTTVTPAHWPPAPAAAWVAEDAPRGLHAETRALEQRRLREALDRSGGNRTQAARALGLSRQGLLKKLRRHGMMPREGAARGLDGPGGAP
jgi:DNA-binding NtrC family response regulator